MPDLASAAFTGSSGSLVGAALETIGYYYQGYILDTLSDVIAGPAAVLVYLAAAIAAVVAFVLSGRAKMTAWFLVGPALFVAIIMTRTQSNGAEWRFGSRPRNQNAVEQQVGAYLGTGANRGPAEVSSLFAAYNRMLSAVIRQVVDEFARIKQRGDLDAGFLITRELRALVTSQSIEENGLRMLIHHEFFTSCRSMIEAAKDARDPLKKGPVRIERAREFIELRKNPIQMTEPALSYTARLLSIYSGPGQVALTGTTEDLARELERTATFTIPPNSDPSAPVSEELVAKIRTSTCGQVENYVYLGLFVYAWTLAENTTQFGEANGIPKNQLIKDLLLVKREGNERANNTKNAATDLQVLTRVIAQYILRNELHQQSGAAFIKDYVQRGSEYAVLSGGGESDLSILERSRLKVLEWSERRGIIATAVNLPYYQGLILYFLGIAFPFFALVLLVPGRQNGFLLWFMLWLWAKSWDIGFAVVMLLDDLLYSIMKKWESVAEAGRMGIQPNLADTLFALRELDPTFNLTTYYILIGACLAAIPMISGYLILGSLKAGFGLIAEGMSGFSQILTSRAGSVAGQPGVNSEKFDALTQEVYEAERKVIDVTGGQSPEGTVIGDFPRHEMMHGVGMPSATAHPPGETTDHYVDSAQRVGTASGAAFAASRNYAGKIGDLLPTLLAGSPGARDVLRDTVGLVTGGVKTWADYEIPLRQARMDWLADIMASDLHKSVTATPYKTFASDFVKERTARAILYGAIAVPWTSKKGGWEEELDNEIMMYRNQRLFAAAPDKALARAIANFSWSKQGAINAAVASVMELRRRSEENPEYNEGLERFELPPGAVVAPPRRRERREGPGGVFDSPSVPQGGQYDASRPGGRRHAGVDLRGELGEPLEAKAGGTVIFTRTGARDRDAQGGFGNMVIIKGDDGRLYLYSHLEDVDVTEGQRVQDAGALGTVGQTGRATGPHTHFAIVEGFFDNVDGKSERKYRYIDPSPDVLGASTVGPPKPIEPGLRDILDSALAKHQDR